MQQVNHAFKQARLFRDASRRYSDPRFKRTLYRLAEKWAQRGSTLLSQVAQEVRS